ncbi:probable palmitoyltransferase ZDHHC24 [Ptychodera flava]|uniref:probable palmitoyltransferase ZDHHC24 n=1 Tax=Ptychodera flava TaxID=63121 RepID=UPI003969C92E
METEALPKARHFLPKGRGDRFAFVFTVVMLAVICIFEAFVILPDIYPEYGTMYVVYVCIGAYLYLNTMGNFLMMIYIDITSGSRVLPAILKPGWRYCPMCMQNSPPRSFHCFQCNICIMKRDHHCVFAGKCVGYYNQRYYFVTLIYLTLGALYANYLNFDHAWALLGGINWRSILTMILPFMAWILGFTEKYTFMMSFLCGTCIITFGLFSVLLFWHGDLILKGQTTHEKSVKDKSYDLGWRENVKEALGERWKLVWLSPFISSPLPGDGIEFKKRSGMENIKDM